jgi:hypothetical protein
MKLFTCIAGIYVAGMAVMYVVCIAMVWHW